MTITINGQSFTGSSITIRNGTVIVDGQVQGDSSEFVVGEQQPVIQIEGDVETLNTDLGVVVSGDVTGPLDAGRDVDCGNVNGNVDAGRNLGCGDITGNAQAGRDVQAGNIGKCVSAGRDVECFEISGSVTAGRDVG